MKAAIVLLALAACSDTPLTKTESSQKSMLWTCYTHAGCDGNVVDQAHRLCAAASDQDYVTVGDAAARDWVTLWDGACDAQQGIVTPTAERAPGQVCVVQSTNAPAPWSCDADCVPEFEGC